LLRLLGLRIRAARRAHELSQQQLADRAAVSRNFVSVLERGLHSVDLLRLRRLAAALGMTLDTLLRGIDQPPPGRDHSDSNRPTTSGSTGTTGPARTG
jgi:transcriptional regulator with XRE-family HTH domain